mgnify:CR=1 FL=1
MKTSSKRIVVVLTLALIISFSSLLTIRCLFFWDNYEIPIQSRDAVNSVNPDYIFDMGDLTESGQEEEYKAYHEWASSLEGQVFPIQGGHDREHREGDPYGTGFFTEGDFHSPTCVLKMGNNIFILISEDRYYYQEEGIWLHHVTDQLHDWIEEKLEEYAVNNTNIFIFEHCPLKNTVAWSDGEWWATGDDPWEDVSERWMELLTTYEDHVVAHISGHMHTHYAWEDTPNDVEEYGFGDGDQGVENVGHFVNGNETEALPDVYFLNPQALCYTHGSAWPYYETSAIYYYDLEPMANNFTIKTRDIHTKMDVDSYIVKTDFPINISDGKMRFIESKTTIVSKHKADVCEKNWLEVKKGSIITFHKSWNLPVEDISIEFEPAKVKYDVIELEEKDQEVYITVEFKEKAMIHDVNILPDEKLIPDVDSPAERVRIVLLTDIHFDSPKNGHEFGGVQVDLLAHFGWPGKIFETSNSFWLIIIISSIGLLISIGIYIWKKRTKIRRILAEK